MKQVTLSSRRNSPQRSKPSSFSRLHDHTQTHHTREHSSGRVMDPSQEPLTTHTPLTTDIHRIPLDEGSDRCRDLNLKTHNTHNGYLCPRWDSNPQSQQARVPQTRALDSAATGVDNTNGTMGGFFELETILRKRTYKYVGNNEICYSSFSCKIIRT